MKNLMLGSTISAPEIGLGCMRLPKMEPAEAERLIRTSMELGVNFFDHADVYGRGEAEAIFAKVVGMNSGIREQMILQTKCAIRPGCCYDFSKEHILKSVEGSLRRLNTDYVDILLLHRPDALMEPEEVAEAFRVLKESGKVRYFGVSNHNPYQIELLNQYCESRLLINQLQLSIASCGMIDAGLNVNMHNEAGINRDGAVLDYCRLHDITIQAWSPFQYGFFEGIFLGSEKYPELNRVLDELAEKYNVTNNAIAIAWILRHPAKIQPIVGTTNRERLREICKASDITLTREEWYALYLAAGKKLP
ncbi:aldo/keto reductase [Acetanaerobacterium elongatum]|uniref:Predicted oxidoreductase n=1 Tax=Acetanaerobacterium elongatum TaxID=258515 RepID=A0A1G9W236_9FIRM|nr:aldo/keto reductase [Acetanaerobacterium elongatum]SDM78612.1 Predicted oxidoreductase [Acetanaerobacterium elongatum]